MATDFSGCVEMTAAYVNFHYLRDKNCEHIESNQEVLITFDFTGNSQERIYGKDPTGVTDVTTMTFFLDEFQLNCSSGGSYIGFYDGSGGTEIGHPIYCVSDLGCSQVWNFGDYALPCLTGETTQSLCISATQNGFISGLIKGHWGIG